MLLRNLTYNAQCLSKYSNEDPTWESGWNANPVRFSTTYLWNKVHQEEIKQSVTNFIGNWRDLKTEHLEKERNHTQTRSHDSYGQVSWKLWRNDFIKTSKISKRKSFSFVLDIPPSAGSIYMGNSTRIVNLKVVVALVI